MIASVMIGMYIYIHHMTCVMCVRARALLMKYILHTIPILIHLDKIRFN